MQQLGPLNQPDFYKKKKKIATIICLYTIKNAQVSISEVSDFFTALKYQDAEHFFILATDNNAGLEEIRNGLHQSIQKIATKKLNARHVLLFSIDDNKFLEELRQKFVQIDADESSKYLETGNVLIFAFQDDGKKLELFVDDGSNLQELPVYDEILAYELEPSVNIF